MTSRSQVVAAAAVAASLSVLIATPRSPPRRPQNGTP